MSNQKNQPQASDIKEPQITADQPALKDVVKTDLSNVTPEKKEEPVVEVKHTHALGRALTQQNVPGQLTPKEDTSGQIIIRSILREYAKDMAPAKPVSEAVGAGHQLKLWRAIEQVLNSKGEFFHLHLNTLMEEILKERKSAFNEKYAFRFFHRVELPANNLKSFERLLNLFINTCDPKGRSHALKQIDMEKTLEKIPNEEIRQRIFAFYQHK